MSSLFRMRLIIAAILFASTAAYAGPYDELLDTSPCKTGFPAAWVVLPDGLHAGHDADNPKLLDLAYQDKGGEPVYGFGTEKELGNGLPSWCAATVEVSIGGKTETLVVSDVNAHFYGDETDDFNDDVMQWSIPIGDADATAAAKAGTLTVPAALSGNDAAPDASKLVTKLTSTKKLAALAAKKLIVVGSAAGQIWQGAAAKKTLGKWNLDLAVDPHVVSGKDASLDEAWVVANVTATPHGKKGAASITYRVLYGLYRTKNKKWHVGLVHFALVQ